MGLSELLIMNIAQKSLDLSDGHTAENGHLLLSRWPVQRYQCLSGGRGGRAKGLSNLQEAV